MTTTVWDTVNLSGVTLSGVNLVATCSVISGSVRGADGLSTGKFYFEITINTIVSINTNVGIAAGDVQLAAQPVSNQSVSVEKNNGAINCNGVNSGFSLGALAATNVIGIAVDLDSQLAWFRIGAAGNWNGQATGDPVAQVKGVSFAALGKGGLVFYPIAGFGAVSDKVTANFGGSAFTGTVPTGYTSGWTAGSGVGTAYNIVTQAGAEAWVVNPANFNASQVGSEVFQSATSINTQYVVSQVGSEVWQPVATATNATISGVGGAGGVGTLIANPRGTITGVNGTGQVGTLSASVSKSVTLTGIASTAHSGTITTAVTVSESLPALDTHDTSTSTGGTTTTIHVSATGANEVIVVYSFVWTLNSSAPALSISGGGSHVGSWTAIQTATNHPFGISNELGRLKAWYAITTGAVTNQTVTITSTGTINAALNGYSSWSNTYLPSPFDPYGSGLASFSNFNGTAAAITDQFNGANATWITAFVYQGAFSPTAIPSGAYVLDNVHNTGGTLDYSLLTVIYPSYGPTTDLTVGDSEILDGWSGLGFAFANPTFAGAAATCAVGTLTTSISVTKTLTGIASTTQTGALSLQASSSRTLTGIAATAHAGTTSISISGTANLVGVAAHAAFGTVKASHSITLTGIASTSAVGTLTTGLIVHVSGIAATAQTGTITKAISTSARLTGAFALAIPGYTSTPPFNLNLELSPIVGHTAVNSPTIRLRATLHGVHATARRGVLTKEFDALVTGVQTSCQAGTVQPYRLTDSLRMDNLIVRGVPSTTQIAVSLSWSDDKGYSFSNEVEQTLGDLGQFLTSPQWRRLGFGRDRVFKIQWAAATATALTGCFIQVTESKT